MTLPSDALRVKVLAKRDLDALAAFRCSSGDAWEHLVEQEVQGPLPKRYLAPRFPAFDPRMLLVIRQSDSEILAIGAHHIEPTVHEPTISYTEAIAVALSARGTLVETEGKPISLGHYTFAALVQDMLNRGRAPITFGRVDRRNARSIALCQRIGLVLEKECSGHPGLMELWGDIDTVD